MNEYIGSEATATFSTSLDPKVTRSDRTLLYAALGMDEQASADADASAAKARVLYDIDYCMIGYVHCRRGNVKSVQEGRVQYVFTAVASNWNSSF